MDFTAVLAQIKPKLGCVADNLTTIEGQIAKARDAGANLIVCTDSAVLVASALQANQTGEWTAITGGATIISPSNNITPVYNLSIGDVN